MNEILNIPRKDGIEELEMRLLLDGLYEYYGYDFRDYTPGTLKRRIRERILREQLSSIAGLLEKILHDPACMNRLVGDISISVSTMFRDPGFFVVFRNEVVPMLQTYPFIRIWHAGCARGEEVYSLAILFHEERLYDRCRIYATDMNEDVIKQARDGIFSLKQMKEYTRNYIAAGGKRAFSEYYTARYGNAIIHPWLKKNIVFSRHCLTTDGPFNEFNAILCRNVVIYFNRSLQTRAHDLFYNSLTMFGFLGLGRKESIRFTPHESCYKILRQHEKIYKKVK